LDPHYRRELLPKGNPGTPQFELSVTKMLLLADTSIFVRIPIPRTGVDDGLLSGFNIEGFSSSCVSRSMS
jgi:hypothetical protein